MAPHIRSHRPSPAVSARSLYSAALCYVSVAPRPLHWLLSGLTHMLLFLLQKFEKWSAQYSQTTPTPHIYPNLSLQTVVPYLTYPSILRSIFLCDWSRRWVFPGTWAAQWQAWSSWNTRPAPSGPLSCSLSHSVVGWRVTLSGKKYIR